MNSGTSSRLNGVWGSSYGDVFAVGEGWGADGYWASTILHFDGTAWAAMPIPDGYALRGIWGTSASDVYAVGTDGQILHYNGATWSQMTAGTWPALSGVWGSSPLDVFAVGNAGTILHYDGLTWSEMPSDEWDYLKKVWGTSPSDVFAVGYNYRDDAGVILHYDGSTWTRMATVPDPLQGLWGSSSNDVYAMCEGSKVLHWNGSAWTERTLGANSLFFGVIWGSAWNDVLAGGLNGTILHFNGAAWSDMHSRAPASVLDIWGTSSNDVFAVGYHGMILHYSGEETGTPTITIASPNGGERWPRGRRRTITWTSTENGGRVSIQLKRGSTTVRTIARRAPNTGSFAWRIPSTIPAGRRYKIRILSRATPAAFDFSDAVFSIR